MSSREIIIEQWNLALKIANLELIKTKREKILEELQLRDDDFKILKKTDFKFGESLALNQDDEIDRLKELYFKLNKKGISFLSKANLFVSVIDEREEILKNSLLDQFWNQIEIEYCDLFDDFNDYLENNSDFNDIYSQSDFSTSEKEAINIRMIQLKNAIETLSKDEKKSAYIAISMIVSILKNEQIYLNLPSLPSLPTEVKECLKYKNPAN